MSVFQVDGFAFFNNFECANLANVARGNPSGTSADGGGKAVNFAFNVWTSPDAAGTAFENKNRSWFCFGVTGGPGNCWIELTVMNMNRQKRLFNQGMMPAYMVLPSQPYWDRIPGKPVTYYYIGPDFVVTFQFKMPIDPGAEVYFAMTYPHNNAKIMAITDRLTSKFLCSSSIYFHREFLCYSAEGRRLDLLTISSFDGIGAEGEFEDPFDLTPLEEMADMKGNISQSMPRCFPGKKVIFISSRVHPGEVQATYVLNGFLKFLLSDSDPRAFLLRKAFIIPNLNPDGVVRGHYRTDHRGVNLNRVYQAPCPLHHPTIFATRVLFMYHAAQSRKGAPDKEEECDDQGFTVPAETEDITTVESSQAVNRAFTGQVEEGIKSLSKVVKDEACQAVQERAASLDEETQTASVLMKTCEIQAEKSKDACSKYEDRADVPNYELSELEDCWMRRLKAEVQKRSGGGTSWIKTTEECGIFLYLDLHGHASKRGTFVYGNHMEDTDSATEALMFPKIMALNCSHFDFAGCDFRKGNTK
ncbi:unnamed protein product [Cyprideis torosa]|uniref:Peptidase M14 domain-containing protein n=1 Tax=Cyprideis torosa TaxID=163714 RepID=A0A7R8WK06_9CRUS|nr:unnamed protein product [Cyprideis torosa]CAG0899851.1 unnamed protein product [Cyprideis torosa]